NRRGSQWQLHDKGGSPILTFAQRLDPAIVQLHEIPADGKAQSEAAVPVVHCCALPVALENVGQGVGGDSPAGVGHGELNRIRAPPAAYLDASTGRSEADGVGEKVRYDLLDAVGIDIDRSADILESGANDEAPVVGRRPVCLDDSGDQRRE